MHPPMPTQRDAMRLRHTLTATTTALLLTALLTPTADANTTTGAILGSDLEAIRIDPNPTVPNGTTTLHAHVVNKGPATTTAPLTITIQLPRGAEAEEPFFPDTCTVGPLSQNRTIRCTFPAGLRSQRTATAQIPISLSPDLTIGTTLTGGWFRVTDILDDPNPTNNRTNFEIQVVEIAPGA
ncbi:hypothetical protein ACFV0B_26840 [Streptomyces xanthophaeus]|uniref:hypothetical protein n=1 Tax=Streptomyces xanthophaeus TaxID=67385 RepID=UPI0036987CD7